VDGKADWLAYGLPRAGEQANVPYIGDLADPDPPSCGLSDEASVVRARIEGSRYDSCLVLGDQRIVLGRVPRSALSSSGDSVTAERLMDPGPSTVRANKRLPGVAERLAQGGLDAAIVTTPRGRLIGVVHRADVERAAATLEVEEA
jgi:CBS domain-containing protein